MLGNGGWAGERQTPRDVRHGNTERRDGASRAHPVGTRHLPAAKESGSRAEGTWSPLPGASHLTQCRDKTCHPETSFCPADYFKLKTIKAQEPREETLTFPQLPKRISIEGLFPKQSYRQRSLKRTRAGCGGRVCRAWRPESSLSHCVCRLSKHSLTKHLLFPLHVNCLPPP